MATASDDFELSMDDLRVVARYAAEAAQEVLPLFEESRPDDHRPRAALDAAWAFVAGANRTQLQRVTAVNAHRAAKDAATGSAKYAALAAGDAAASAYLHSLPNSTQVGHILRAAAHAARAIELAVDDRPGVGDDYIAGACARATRDLVNVLLRYPPAPSAGNRVAGLMKALDTALRAR
ncbi:MAG: Uncharacterized protein JWM93_1074 [Frankiales bacterium]|nr:Uncharacterized protein [Frankiales bacterium]